MNLTPEQRAVLLALTTDWQKPLQIVNQIPEASDNLSDIQQELKDLLQKRLAQINPVVLGLYRLTPDGIKLKELELGADQ